MGSSEVKSFCRICSGVCGVVLTVQDGRIRSIRGDQDHPMTSGYACFKGLQADAILNDPERLLHPLKRRSDGGFDPISPEQALEEIAERAAELVEARGARALGLFRGTLNYRSTAGLIMSEAFMRAIGSPSIFSTATIDQSAKFVAQGRIGTWRGGPQPFEESDVWAFVGYNPLVSVQGGMGFPALNPARRLKEAKARGMKILVIDPRRTETARAADLFLQPIPGQDAALAAGLLHVVLAEGWYDRAFCEAWVEGLDVWRRAVRPFTPEATAARTGVPAGDVVAAAAMFARDGRRGRIQTGTGPDMGPYSNLAEHLYECLNLVCGRMLREGERVPNPGVVSPQPPRHADVAPPRRSWEEGVRSHVGGLGTIVGEMMSGALADMILTPGEGQVRALFVVGGNPASVLPEEPRALKALADLDLLVTVDPRMTATARLSHYVLPPKILYERADLACFAEHLTYPEPFSQYSDAVVPPPPGSELLDDWMVFWAVARRLGRPIRFMGAPLDMERPPTNETLLRLRARKARVPFEALRADKAGRVYDVAEHVLPARPDRAARLQLAPADVMDEFAGFAAEPPTPAGRLLLVVRRMRDAFNTGYQNLPAIRKRTPANPLSIHPDDARALGLCEGDLAWVESDSGRLRAAVVLDDTLRPGVVSLTHGWGGGRGVNVNALTSARLRVQAINAMPQFSALPVKVTAARAAHAAAVA
jgi:anaerobic selenocysteine-containing dehydrogenase